MRNKIKGLGVIVIAICMMITITGCENSNSSNGTANNGNNNSNNVTPTQTASSYKVKYNGFTFSVPDNMMYEVLTDELMVGDEDGTWVVGLMVTDGNFNQVKNNMSMLQSYFQQNGFTATPAEVKSLNGSEFITLEMIKSGVNFVGAYAKLNSMKIAWMIAYNQSNTFDYSILEKMAPIIKSAIYDDASNSIATTPDFNFNMDEMSQFAK